MTFTKYLILVWSGSGWKLEEDPGPDPGPYDRLSQAKEALEEFIERDVRCLLADRADPYAAATAEERVAATEHEKWLRENRTILEVRGWPDAPEGA